MVPGSCVGARRGLLDRKCSSHCDGAAFGSGPKRSDVQVLIQDPCKSIKEVQYRLLLSRLITMSDCKSGPPSPAPHLSVTPSSQLCGIIRRSSRRSRWRRLKLNSAALRPVRCFRTTSSPLTPPFQARNTGPLVAR